MSSPCVLSGLADPRLGGALPGLTVTSRELMMAQDSFMCCEGTGTRLDRVLNTSSRCDLRRRTAAVAALVLQFRRTWGDDEKLPLSLAARDVADLARRTQRDSFATQKGRSLARNAKTKGPSPLWAIAFAAAWRFGTSVHVATLGRTPWEQLTNKLAESPLVVIVERIDELWDVRRADELEFVVGWAYQARAQLWCDWLLHVVPSEQNASPRRSAMNRIAKMRGRSPLSWLNADMHSKLQFLTEGLEPIIQWPTSKAKQYKPSPRPPVDLGSKIQ